MTTLTCAGSFVPTNIGVKACFCGKATVEDHEFCFCSPQCARADAMRALGEDDCHYRKVMRKACAQQGSSEPAIHRHKSEYQLRRASRISGISHHPSKPTHEKTLPTLAEVTSSILAREGRSEGSVVVSDAFVCDPRRPCESQNEYFEPITTHPIATIPHTQGGPQQTLKRSLPSKAGLNKSIRNSVLAFFRKPTEKSPPLNVERKVPTIRKEPSVTAIAVEDTEEENEEEAAFWRMVNRTEDTSRPHQARSITTSRQSGGIRRSASFASWNRPAANWKSFEEESDTMKVVFQLRQVWNEVPDVVPNFDERSDEE
ncbi:hypothetical protein K503DRAFT_798014 [Rhizopogon vinicolor AM-OR11-026]|uniref:Uncharacterized protein n=1 Tax=Rhizopogon vinicolor AM-OR11-026 TaxID=1314800 RepID=A0A1B7N9A7_9AGAM|nr:hypothetical protein K503DRAFT_798014 [Rhizopogon vinicolor AM-OR11-026]